MPDYQVKKVDLTQVRPYGDTMNDGAVQLSFTLPVPHTPEAVEAARQLALKLGLRDAAVHHSEDLGGYSFFVIYGHTQRSIDLTTIQVAKVESPVPTRDEADATIQQIFSRPLVVVGACIGSDAHTVGIDAIMNMKGFAGNYGLERYPEISALNMGSQVPCAQLLKTALERKADAILVSQIVTQKNIHVQHLTQLIELLEAEGVRERFVLVVGGPRINNAFAKELGYDAGFGPRTTPLEVASFLAQEVVRRSGKA